jgi:hypothetical protein
VQIPYPLQILHGYLPPGGAELQEVRPNHFVACHHILEGEQIRGDVTQEQA